jgi:hypothetical protein
MATRLNSSTFGYQNFFSATLSGDITAGTTVIGLSTVPTPTAGILVFEPDSTTNREVVLYTTKGASTVTAPSDGRGYSGTVAAAHLQGTSVIMAPVDKWFTALASGELSSDPLRTELFYDYVASGLVWTADAAGSTKNASMTSGVLYILGKRLTLVAVTARVFTASKDTYIDVSDNGDGTGLITYNEVTNNAASPALATNNIRIGIIVTGATNIATSGSVNQGQQDRVLPIASSIPYAVTDSLGNLIFPTDPLRRVLGYRQIVSSFTTTATTVTDVTGLSVPVIVPTGRKVRITIFGIHQSHSAATGTQINASIRESSTTLASEQLNTAGVSFAQPLQVHVLTSPTAGAHTYLASVSSNGTAGTYTVAASATTPTFVLVELV